MTTKLEKLLQKEAQLKAQIQDAKARERTLEKKRDTRRKILVGAAVMARVEHGDWPESDLKMMMDGFLTRESERELFGLDGDDAGRSASRESLAQTHRQANADKAAAAGSSAKEKAGKQRAKKLPVSSLDIEAEFNL